MTLIALGFRNFSMAATAIGPVKAMVLSLDAGAAASELKTLLADPRSPRLAARAVAGARRASLRPPVAPSAASHASLVRRAMTATTNFDIILRRYEEIGAAAQRRRDRRRRLCGAVA